MPCKILECYIRIINVHAINCVLVSELSCEDNEKSARNKCRSKKRGFL